VTEVLLKAALIRTGTGGAGGVAPGKGTAEGVGVAVVAAVLVGAVAEGVGAGEYAAMAVGATSPLASPTAASTSARVEGIRQRDMTTPND
jgi:hypothetical protein